MSRESSIDEKVMLQGPVIELELRCLGPAGGGHSWERSARALEIELRPKRSVESSTSSQSIYFNTWTLNRKHDYSRHSRLL